VTQWIRLTMVLALVLVAWPGAAQEELDFLGGLEEFGKRREILPAYLRGRAEALLDARRREVAALSSAQSVAARRDYIRRKMEEAVGGFPERTPLNPRVTGVLDRPDYRIEKIIFESQPKFYVTANLYIPKTGSPPYPAVLYPLGHEQGGKSHETWQIMLGSLARQGYVCLTWDPLGQGERAQLYDPDLERRKLGGSTTEHTMLGIQCLLTGDNVARYTIWDGIRALDYLLSRPEVDPKRVACTGNSGGGTHTAYLSALDDRIHVAAPSCYLTSWSRLLETIGPQDAEQVLLPWLAAGLDHGDFVLAFAPKPYLMLSAIRDFFSISGARATYQEARGVYTQLGAEEKLAMSEVDAAHGYHRHNRLAAYAWFARWLKGQPATPEEPPIDLAEFEELACTETGQVATSLAGETVFSLNRKRAEALDPKLPAVRAPGDLAAFQEEVRRRVSRRAGARREPGRVEVRPYGTISRAEYSIEKLVYDSEPDIPIPALLFVPAAGPARKPAAIYVQPAGKSADAALGGEIEWLTQRGFIVLAPDFRGWGESAPAEERYSSDWPGHFGDYSSAMTAFLISESLAGMRANDIVRGVEVLAQRSDVDTGRIYGIGKRQGAVPLLYAAVMDQRLSKLVFDEMLVSYSAVVRRPVHRRVFESVVPGALREFDLPDLVASLAPRGVVMANPVNPLGNRLAGPEAQQAYAGSADVYRAAGADNLRVVRPRPGDGPQALYTAWLDR